MTASPPGGEPGGPAVDRAGRALGSPLHLTLTGLPGTDPASIDPIADAAWAAVTEVFDDVDRAMSRFREDSELVALCNRSPEPLPAISRTLVRGLTAADRAVRITGGRFDPRIIEALERIGYEGAPLATTEQTSRSGPAAQDGLRPRAIVASRVLLRDGRHGPVSLPVPVDLGGIGKGLAVRWAANRIGPIVEPATQGFLLEAGGDLVASGTAPQGGPWMVGIENPDGSPDPLAVLEVVDRGAVATSSIRRLRWVKDGKVVHHLIDPLTGEPGGAGLRAVTVAGSDPAWAEVWSKSLVLEGATGIADAARRKGLAAWWATEDGRLEMTVAARMMTVWVAGENVE